jgi:hypothetical protein
MISRTRSKAFHHRFVHSQEDVVMKTQISQDGITLTIPLKKQSMLLLKAFADRCSARGKKANSLCQLVASLELV